MCRILAIILVAAVLLLALSVPALAAPSEPPNAFGQYNAWLVKVVQQNAKADPDDYIHNGYGRCYLAPIMWATWYGTVPWDNGGDYIADMKDYASYE